jgi:hypothetical protein
VNEFLDIAFPYRRKRNFGAASFALIFITIVIEVEALALVALGIIGHRFDLFVDLQAIVFPSACAIALAAAAVFWWRARQWTRSRVQMLNLWAGGGSTASEHIAEARPQD